MTAVSLMEHLSELRAMCERFAETHPSNHADFAPILRKVRQMARDGQQSPREKAA